MPFVHIQQNADGTQSLVKHPLADAASISLCMIVRDEERVLRDCLTSAKPFFREIIVVDTGSVDRTKEIAHELADKVIDFPWTDSFSEARNESLRHATSDWIFYMDADDTLPYDRGEILIDLALHGPREIGAYIVPVRFVDESATVVDHVKLFRNVKGLAFEFRIHEQILPSLRAAGLEVARSDAYVLHSGYDTSEEGQAKKRARDEKLLMMDLAERPNHPFVLFNLGMTAHYLNDHEAAIEWLHKCIEHSHAEATHLRKAYALLGTSYRQLKEFEQALEVYSQGILAVPGDAELHFLSAHLHSDRGDYREARENYLNVALSSVGSYFSSFDVGIVGPKLWNNLGVVNHQLGMIGEAERFSALCTKADGVNR